MTFLDGPRQITARTCHLKKPLGGDRKTMRTSPGVISIFSRASASYSYQMFCSREALLRTCQLRSALVERMDEFFDRDRQLVLSRFASNLHFFFRSFQCANNIIVSPVVQISFPYRTRTPLEQLESLDRSASSILTHNTIVNPDGRWDQGILPRRLLLQFHNNN